MAKLSNINGKFAVEDTGAIRFSDQTGTTGQILKSNGNSAPTWVDPNTVGTGPWLPLAGGVVSGATTFQSSLTVGGLLTGANATFNGLMKLDAGGILQFGANTATPSMGVAIHRSAADTLNFVTASTNRLTIDSSGNSTFAPTGGVITLGANGHITSKQSLDVATAGGRYIGSSNRGILGQIRIEQTTTSADGGYIAFDTCASGSTSPAPRMTIDSSGQVLIDITGTTGGDLSGGGLAYRNNSGSYLQLSSGVHTDAAVAYFYRKDVGGTSVESFGNISNSGLGLVLNGGGQSNQLVLDSSGNVGIGTDDPDAQLHLNKAIAAGSDNLLLRLQNPTTATDARVGIAFSVNDHTGTNWDGAYIQAENDGIAQADLTFGSAKNNSLSQHMIIEGNTGNVGIGTDSPVFKLDIRTSTPGDRAVLGVNSATSGTNYGGQFNSQGSGATKNIGLYATAEGATTNYAGIFDSGNVGINDTNPNTANLSIKGQSTGVSANYPMLKLLGQNTSSDGLHITTTGTGNDHYAIKVATGADSSAFAVTNAGNVGIGTTAPDDLLTLAGNTNSYSTAPIVRFDSTSTANVNIRNWAIGPADSEYGNFHIFKSAARGGDPVDGTGSATFTINYNGNVAIGFSGTNNHKFYITDGVNRGISDAQIHINGNGYSAFHYLDGTGYHIQQNSDYRSLILISGTSGGVKLTAGATSWVSNSDESLKENIKPLENVLDKIKDYRCIEYNLIDDKTKGKKIGFIAQDWEDDFAPIVDKDENDLLGMKYTETIPVLLKAIQELKAEIELLKNK